MDLYTWDHRNRLTSVNTYGPLESAKFGFDSDEGAYIPEDTGKGVPGELLGNTHYVEANNPQQIANYLALSFDGNGDTVMGGIQDAFTLTPKGMTMTLWFKPSGTQSNQTLVTYGSLAAGESGGYQLRYSYVPGSGSSTESLQFLLNDGIGSSQTVSYALPASIQGQWHHVAVSVALTGQITMYVDGSAVTSATNTQTAAFGNVTTPLQLGMSGTTNAYTGLLDDVRFFALPIGSTHVAWTLQHGYAENVNIGKVEYAYNARNELITRKADADGTSGYQTELREHYIYDEGQIVLRLNSDGGVTHRYLWTNEVDQLLADEVVGGTTLWALSDHLGTVRDLVKYDASSSALDVVHRAFDSFGNVTQEVNPTNADILFGFTGRQFDPVADLQNNLNRWYDAAVGEWISEDPIGFAGGDANLNRYVQNSPISHVDPLGTLKFRSGFVSHLGISPTIVYPASGTAVLTEPPFGAGFTAGWKVNNAAFKKEDGCCTQIGIVQIVKETVIGVPSYLSYLFFDFNWSVDGNEIPYTYQSQIFGGSTSGDPRTMKVISMEDGPYINGGLYYGHFKYRLDAETFVICLEGSAGLYTSVFDRDTKLSNTEVYAGVKWHYEVIHTPSMDPSGVLNKQRWTVNAKVDNANYQSVSNLSAALLRKYYDFMSNDPFYMD